MAHCHRQPADVIVMAVADGDGIERLRTDQIEQGQTLATLAFRMHAGVHEQAVIFHLHEPRARADDRVRLICDLAVARDKVRVQVRVQSIF